MTIEINDKGYTELYRLKEEIFYPRQKKKKKKEIQFYYFNLIVLT